MKIIPFCVAAKVPFQVPKQALLTSGIAVFALLENTAAMPGPDRPEGSAEVIARETEPAALS